MEDEEARENIPPKLLLLELLLALPPPLKRSVPVEKFRKGERCLIEEEGGVVNDDDDVPGSMARRSGDEP